MIIDGAWREERMRSQMERAIGKSCFFNDGTINGNRAVIVYNADMEDLPDKSLTELLTRACAQKTNKFILEMNEVSPLFHRRLQSSGGHGGEREHIRPSSPLSAYSVEEKGGF